MNQQQQYQKVYEDLEYANLKHTLLDLDDQDNQKINQDYQNPMKRSEQYFLQTQTDFHKCWDLADWNNNQSGIDCRQNVKKIQDVRDYKIDLLSQQKQWNKTNQKIATFSNQKEILQVGTGGVIIDDSILLEYQQMIAQNKQKKIYTINYNRSNYFGKRKLSCGGGGLELEQSNQKQNQLINDEQMKKLQQRSVQNQENNYLVKQKQSPKEQVNNGHKNNLNYQKKCYLSQSPQETIDQYHSQLQQDYHKLQSNFIGQQKEFIQNQNNQIKNSWLDKLYQDLESNRKVTVYEQFAEQINNYDSNQNSKNSNRNNYQPFTERNNSKNSNKNHSFSTSSTSKAATSSFSVNTNFRITNNNFKKNKGKMFARRFNSQENQNTNGNQNNQNSKINSPPKNEQIQLNIQEKLQELNLLKANPYPNYNQNNFISPNKNNFVRMKLKKKENLKIFLDNQIKNQILNNKNNNPPNINKSIYAEYQEFYSFRPSPLNQENKIVNYPNSNTKHEFIRKYLLKKQINNLETNNFCPIKIKDFITEV